MDKANIRAELDALEEHWCQKTLARANGNQFKVAKGLGATNWHKHDDQDELFIIFEGEMVIHLREPTGERLVRLGAGEIFSVPRGTEHRPIADEEVKFMVVGKTITSTPEGGKPN